MENHWEGVGTSTYISGSKMYQGVFIKEHNVLERWGVHYV